MKMNEIYDLDYISSPDSATLFNILASDTETYALVSGFIKSGNKETLNLDYYLGHSADKYISPLHEKLIDGVDKETSDWVDVMVKLAKIVYNRFGNKWKHIYDALVTEYNPLENYSMEEERTPDLTFEDTETQNSEITTERETSAENKYKGFNAVEPVLVNKTDGEESTTTSGASADNEVHKTTTHTGTETLTRSGNIGVTTSQQMLQSEFEVRQYDFYKMMYNDIDSLLCLSIY